MLQNIKENSYKVFTMKILNKANKSKCLKDNLFENKYLLESFFTGSIANTLEKDPDYK
jgi:hypothetical protein